MKSNINRNFMSRLVEKLKIEPMEYEQFLEELSKNKNRIFNDLELEFELLIVITSYSIHYTKLYDQKL